MKYGGGFGKLEGLHEVRYEDGVCEWKALKRFRVVVDGKAFTKAVYGKWAGLQDKTGRTY